MAKKLDAEELERKFNDYVQERFLLINSDIKYQQTLFEVTDGESKAPIRPPRQAMTRKTRENLERVKHIICGNTKYDNLRQILTDYDRYKILIDFYLVADGLKIDSKKRKNRGNANRDIRFMDSKGNYIFALPLYIFIKLRGGTRNSISRNINLFSFLGFIEKRNPYEIETNSIIKQNENREFKIERIQHQVTQNRIDLGEKKIDFNFTSLYIIPVLNRNIFAAAEKKASKLYEVNFSIRAFTSIFLFKYFGIEEAEKVYFHKNLIEFTEYSSMLQNKIKDAVIEQIEEKGYTTKRITFNKVKQFCVAKDFEIIERYGRPRVSAWNTFETEYKRILGEILKDNSYIKLSSTPTKQMKKIFGLRTSQHILYDSRKLKK